MWVLLLVLAIVIIAGAMFLMRRARRAGQVLAARSQDPQAGEGGDR